MSFQFRAHGTVVIRIHLTRIERSSRMIYNMKQNNFNALGGINLKLDDIKSVIEFGQLGKGKIVLHSSSKDDTTDRLSKVLNASILDDSVPPTSVQSFLEARPTVSLAFIIDGKAGDTM
ncbi:hypothetical protein X777_10909 [Ooceraea biroi]|uniref:Uncharacterized protein n=1 Tax=Ooceraea biroi TaxID=2015173 RepID=A0A026W3E7_OOCBI|nr:hypothetical protein X777_10909 [Ooceraea biroi]